MKSPFEKEPHFENENTFLQLCFSEKEPLAQQKEIHDGNQQKHTLFRN
jgi:hypothetical protein